MDILNHTFATIEEAIAGIGPWCDNCAPLKLSAGTIFFQLFATGSSDQALQISRSIRARFPAATVMGMSSHNSIVEGKPLLGGVLLSISLFEHTDLLLASSPCNGNPAAAMAEVAARLSAPDKRAVICFASGFDASAQSVFANLDTPEPWVGGITDFSSQAGGPWVLLNDQCSSDLIAAVALCSGQLWVNHQAIHEWLPIGRRLRVTACNGQLLQQLDDETALVAYNRYFNDGQNCAFEICQDFPLTWEQQGGREYSAPSRLNEDGSMVMTSAIPLHAEVQFCYFHPRLSGQRLANQLRTDLTNKPEAIFLYNCASRIFNGDGMIAEELEAFSNLAPTAGVYCFGEFASSPHHRIVNHSITYLALSETENPLPRSLHPGTVTKIDLAANFNAVFNLINSASRDLEALNRSLSDEVHRQAEALLSRYRHHPLTGLPLRHAMLETQQQLLAGAVAVAVIKLTNLGHINERYGDAIGDRAIKSISHQLKRECDVRIPNGVAIAQLNAAEWLLVFGNQAAMMRIGQELEQLLGSLEQSAISVVDEQESRTLPLVINAGLYLTDGDGSLADSHSLERAQQKALAARRHAAKENLGSWTYTPSFNAPHSHGSSDLDWMYRVSRALQEGRIEVWGQPIFKSGSRQFSSIECLVRLREGDKIHSPTFFLPAIQKTAIYHKLSDFVITTAIRTLDPLAISYGINLAPQDLFNDTTQSLLLSELKQATNPHLLGIELIESEEIGDYQQMAARLRPMRELGAKLLIDDFGSGYSNLEEVLKLEPCVVKLDGSLVREMDSNPRQRSMVEHLNNLCHALSITTVAEFVRNEAICVLVEELGVDRLQGYFLAEPKPLSSWVEWLAQQR